MLLPLYVVLAIYLLTFSVTLFRSRHSRQGQKIAGLRPLLIAAAILFLGSVIANAAFNFIGAAYLFIALLVAAPLFAFGLGRVLATSLTWLRRFRAVFAFAVILAACSPVALLAFLEFARFQHQQELRAKLVAFQMRNLEATFDSRRVVLPVTPRLALFPSCFDRHSSLKGSCRFANNDDGAPELESSSPHQPPHRLKSLDIKAMSRFSRCDAQDNHECLETSNPRLWCERRSDRLAQAWCEALPDIHIKFEHRETWPSSIWQTRGADETVFRRLIDVRDNEKASLQCDQKAKSYCKFYFKLNDNVLVSAYFQQVDRQDAPRLSADALNRIRRIWSLMTNPASL